MQASLFEGIAEMTRQRVLESAREESYAQRDFIFRQGEPARHFFILGEGRVRLSLGQGELLAYVASDPGDLIGWSSLVENETYTASAECLVPTKVLRFEKQRLDEILHQDTASGMVFFKNLAALIGRRLVKSYQATVSVHGRRDPDLLRRPRVGGLHNLRGKGRPAALRRRGRGGRQAPRIARSFLPLWCRMTYLVESWRDGLLRWFLARIEEQK